MPQDQDRNTAPRMGPQRIRRLQDKANELGKSRDDLLSILSSFSEQKDRLVQQQDRLVDQEDRLVVRDNQITRLEEIIAAQRADKVAHEKLCHTQSGPEARPSTRRRPKRKLPAPLPEPEPEAGPSTSRRPRRKQPSPEEQPEAGPSNPKKRKNASGKSTEDELDDDDDDDDEYQVDEEDELDDVFVVPGPRTTRTGRVVPPSRAEIRKAQDEHKKRIAAKKAKKGKKNEWVSSQSSDTTMFYDLTHLPVGMKGRPGEKLQRLIPIIPLTSKSGKGTLYRFAKEPCADCKLHSWPCIRETSKWYAGRCFTCGNNQCSFQKKHGS